MNETLEYKAPTPRDRRINFPTASVGGVIAGASTFGSAFLVGPLLCLGVGLLAGIILSAVAARASRGCEFRAGFVASGVAAASAFVASLLFARPHVGVVRFDPASSVLIFTFWWALFAVPGLLGSLWSWEGRRPRRVG